VAFGGFEGVVEVFELEFGGAAGFEIAFDHAESVFGEDAGRGETSLESFTDFGGVGTSGSSKDEGFGNGSDGDGDDDLVSEFGKLASTSWADVSGASHGFEDWCTGGKGFRITTDHDGEFASRGSDSSAGDRGIEVGVVEFFVKFAVGDGFVRADGAHVNVSGSGWKCIGYAAIKEDFLNSRTVLEHSNKDVRMLDSF